jgi:hypothetical protein
MILKKGKGWVEKNSAANSLLYLAEQVLHLHTSTPPHLSKSLLEV